MGANAVGGALSRLLAESELATLPPLSLFILAHCQSKPSSPYVLWGTLVNALRLFELENKFYLLCYFVLFFLTKEERAKNI